MKDIQEMKGFMQISDDFKRYVDKCSISYGKSLDEILQSPITREYYKSLQRGGCNAKSGCGTENS